MQALTRYLSDFITDFERRQAFRTAAAGSPRTAYPGAVASAYLRVLEGVNQ